MNSLEIECAYYIAKERTDIDEKFNDTFYNDSEDNYIIFAKFISWLCKDVTSLIDLYKKIDTESVNCVEEFKKELYKEKEIDLFEKVNNMIIKKNQKIENEKNEYLKTIKSLYEKVEKYFDKFNKDMELIKILYDNDIIDFHKDNKDLIEVNKYTEMFGSTMKVADLGYSCAINIDKKMEKMKLYSCYNFRKIEFRVIYENGELYLRTNKDEYSTDYTMVDLKDVDVTNYIINKYYEEIAFVCKGFEKIVDYLDKIEEIIKNL